jgi:hypothetical protein
MASQAKLRTVEDELNERGSIDVAMAAAFAEIEAVTKDKINPHFKSKYADLGSVIEALRPILAAHNLYFIQCSEPSEDGVIVSTYVRHISGGQIDFGKLYVPANKRDAQGFGSALTYARRYALVTAFGVPTEDDDGNAASRAANDRPTTGEAPPRKSAKLDGPYDTLPKLEKAAREFARTLRGMGSLEEFDEWAKDEEVKAFVDQLKRDLPDWWSDGPNTPPDFVPLEIEVRDTRRGLKQIAELETR